MRLSNLGGTICYSVVVDVKASRKQREYCLSVLCSFCPFRELRIQDWKDVDVNIGMDIPLSDEEA